LHDCADEEAERGSGKEQEHTDHDGDREADDKETVPAEADVTDGPVAAEPGRRGDLDVVGAEGEAEELLDD